MDTNTMEYAARLVFSRFDFSTWLWVVFAFLFSFVAIGFLWGCLWNRKWGYLGHITSMVLNLASSAESVGDLN